MFHKNQVNEKNVKKNDFSLSTLLNVDPKCIECRSRRRKYKSTMVQINCWNFQMFWAGSRKAESNWSVGWIFGLWRVRIHLLQLRRSFGFGSHQMKERLNSRICPKNLGGSKYVILKIAPEEKRVVELWEAPACWSGSHQLTQIWCFHLWAAADSQGREEGAIWHSSKLSCWPSAIKHLLHSSA